MPLSANAFTTCAPGTGCMLGWRKFAIYSDPTMSKLLTGVHGTRPGLLHCLQKPENWLLRMQPSMLCHISDRQNIASVAACVLSSEADDVLLLSRSSPHKRWPTVWLACLQAPPTCLQVTMASTRFHGELSSFLPKEVQEVLGHLPRPASLRPGQRGQPAAGARHVGRPGRAEVSGMCRRPRCRGCRLKLAFHRAALAKLIAAVLHPVWPDWKGHLHPQQLRQHGLLLFC